MRRENMKKTTGMIAVLLMSVFMAGCTHAATEPATDEAMMEETSHSSDTMENKEAGEAMDGEDKMMEGETEEMTIDSFKFGYSEEEITVKAGDTVTLTLTNSEGLHDFVIDELDVATKQVDEGETDTVTFTIPADMAGQTLAYYCSVGNHRSLGMEGKLIIE
jgi:plastocyanin